VVSVYDEGISFCGRLWPDYVRKRIKDTYIYFGGSLALTAASATAAFRSPALMRFMTKSSFLVSTIRNFNYYVFLHVRETKIYKTDHSSVCSNMGL
jgi:hypothetical protein